VYLLSAAGAFFSLFFPNLSASAYDIINVDRRGSLLATTLQLPPDVMNVSNVTTTYN
jgi:hypothetical protein